MPGVVAFALEAWVVPALFSEGILIGAAGITFASYAITFAAYYAYGTYQAAQARAAAKNAVNASLQDRLVMTATTSNPRSRCYGRIRNVDGILFKATHGANKEFYTFVVAVAGHEIDGFEKFYMADVAVTVDASGYVQTAPYGKTVTGTEGMVSVGSAASGSYTIVLPAATTLTPGGVSVLEWNGATGEGGYQAPLPFTVAGNVVSWSGGSGQPVYIYYFTDTVVSKARIRGYTGAAGQNIGVELVALGVDNVNATDFQFAGIACMLVTLTFDVDAFPQGVPAFSAVFRGAQLYDPRIDAWQWSENPALIARDWALYQYGGGAVETDLYDDFTTAANACDVMHDFVITSGTGGTVTRPMYTCNTVLPTNGDPSQAMNEIVMSMAGKMAWVGGRLRVCAGAYRAPVATITNDWISDKASIDISAGVARVDLVNSYQPSIADDRLDFVVTPTEAVRADAYITADGMELPRAISLTTVTDVEHAQHVCGVMLRDARQALTVSMPANMLAYPLEVFDTINVTLARFGWDTKLFEILATEFAPTTGMLITCKETDATIFDPDAGFALSDFAPNTELPLPWFVPMPTGLTVTSGATALKDGSILTRTQISWNTFTDASVLQSGNIEVQYIPAINLPSDPTINWPSWPERASSLTTMIPGLLSGTIYVFRARAINSIGVRSAWTPPVQHQIALPPGVTVGWANVVGAPTTFAAVARGFSDTSAYGNRAGLYDGVSGTHLVGIARSYTVCVIKRTTALLQSAQTFDIYGDASAPAAMVALLNGLGPDVIVVVISYDEPAQNRLVGGLDAAMYRCGASPPIYGAPTFMSHAAYVLIGIPGCGEGNGFEGYCDATVPTYEFVDVTFQLQSGNLTVTGTSTVPGSLADYSYKGTLDATTDLFLIARGNCVVSGNYAEKVSGANAWDSDVYSRDSYKNGAFCSARPARVDRDVMFGLNSDPLTDENYTSLDFAWYAAATGNVSIYESGAAIGVVGPYTSNDVLAIVYDGLNVYYLQNGLVKRTNPIGTGYTLFLDSSFYGVNGALAMIRFGPQSNVNDIGASQIVKNAVSITAFAQDKTGLSNVQASVTITTADIPAGASSVPVVVTGCVHTSGNFAFGLSRNSTGTFAGTTPTLVAAQPNGGPGLWTPTVVDNLGVGTFYYRLGFIAGGSSVFNDDFTTVNGSIFLLALTAEVAKR
jgi:hypothetical protein